MLKRLRKVFTNKNRVRVNEPHIVYPEQHSITPDDISRGALRVVDELSAAGYEAYVVGGCVRDLLLDLKPKDFDVATDATPEQVKQLFRRSRIVGRRFQIVHVPFGREVVEVTTFRAHHNGKNSRKSSQSRHGMLLRDNIFGDINQDASRRDFTVNALYYHPQDNTIYDYADGLPDLDQRLIRIIGDPQVRYREDPVRMLRAIRFSAKLGFAIDSDTVQPIHQLAPLLKEISPSRLFDEVIKLLMSGYGLATFRLLREHNLFKFLFPATDTLLNEAGSEQTVAFIEQALINTDHRIRTGQRTTPAFIYAAMLWPVVVEYSKRNLSANESPMYAPQHAAAQAIEQQLPHISIPRRFTTPMREIWELQHRLPRRGGKRAERLIQHPRFRAAYDFVLLREQAGEDLQGLGTWWTEYQEASPARQVTLVNELDSTKPKRRPRRRRPRKRPGGAQ